MNAHGKARLSKDRGAFTLVELMVVVAIMILVAGFIGPALTSMKTADDVTAAAYTVKGILDQARNYAMANNTYTWVGFYEEDISKPSPTPGTGRLVMAIVASKDGTTIYGSTAGNIDPTRLIQVGKLVKVDNIHLPILADGLGTGNTFDTRPPPDTCFDTACSCYNTRSARFGDLNVAVPNSAPSTDSQYPFQYPVGSPAPTAQYTFKKTLQIDPRGEANINSTYNMLRVLEIGFVATHGTAAPSASPSAGRYPGNVVALQLTGVSGDIKIYRR